MRKSSVLALALAAAVLAGGAGLLAACTADSPKAVGVSETAGATSPATTVSVPGGNPAGAPEIPPPPGAAPGPHADPSATPNNGATAHSVPGRPVPPIAALRTGWITAKVTKGGIGPCFTLAGSDGVTYAAYSELGLQLAKGAGLRARIKPGKTPVNCGSGRAVSLEHVQLAG